MAERDAAPDAQDEAMKPAVLFLDDGSTAELPDLTVGEAMALLDLAEDGVLIGGEIDPRRVKSVGYYTKEEDDG